MAALTTTECSCGLVLLSCRSPHIHDPQIRVWHVLQYCIYNIQYVVILYQCAIMGWHAQDQLNVTYMRCVLLYRFVRPIKYKTKMLCIICVCLILEKQNIHAFVRATGVAIPLPLSTFTCTHTHTLLPQYALIYRYIYIVYIHNHHSTHSSTVYCFVCVCVQCVEPQ